MKTKKRQMDINQKVILIEDNAENRTCKENKSKRKQNTINKRKKKKAQLRKIRKNKNNEGRIDFISKRFLYWTIQMKSSNKRQLAKMEEQRNAETDSKWKVKKKYFSNYEIVDLTPKYQDVEVCDAKNFWEQVPIENFEEKGKTHKNGHFEANRSRNNYFISGENLFKSKFNKESNPINEAVRYRLDKEDKIRTSVWEFLVKRFFNLYYQVLNKHAHFARQPSHRRFRPKRARNQDKKLNIIEYKQKNPKRHLEILRKALSDHNRSKRQGPIGEDKPDHSEKSWRKNDQNRYYSKTKYCDFCHSLGGSSRALTNRA